MYNYSFASKCWPFATYVYIFQSCQVYLYIFVYFLLVFLKLLTEGKITKVMLETILSCRQIIVYLHPIDPSQHQAKDTEHVII
jgi:hypothetical protein